MVFLRFFPVMLLWLGLQCSGGALLLYGGGLAVHPAALTAAVLLWQLFCALLTGFRSGAVFQSRPFRPLLLSGSFFAGALCLLLRLFWQEAVAVPVYPAVFLAVLLPYFCAGTLGAGWGRLTQRQKREREERTEESLACGAEKC